MGKQEEQPPSHPYEAPTVRVLGSVQELTQAQAVGPLEDGNFPSALLPHHSV